MVDSAAGILDRETLVGLDLYWRVRLFEYDGCDVKYIGCNQRQGAETSAGTWAVWLYSYTGCDVSMIEGPITGAWDDRDTMDWR